MEAEVPAELAEEVMHTPADVPAAEVSQVPPAADEELNPIDENLEG